MKRTIKILIWIVLIAGAASLLELFVLRKNIKQPAPQVPNNISNQQQTGATNSMASVIADTPTATNSDPVPTSNTAPDTAPASPFPAKFLLPVLFYSQAPLSKWDAFHEEMCEEASILNAGLYLENKTLTKGQFEAELQKIQKIEKDNVDEWKSTTVVQTKKWADIYFGDTLSIKIIDNPTIEDIETEIAAGHPVAVPLSGRDIGNPNFTPPGPVYHMLVVKGYDTQNFITNDVGTRKGDSYTYAKDVIMKNMHDWNPQDIHLGAKRVLVLYK
ncbi:MAG: C39 family peptidase [Candidatus Moranbacteria bacterium]|nr:C39 family peptidase [Candidatus Moranbacteria bacterium]